MPCWLFRTGSSAALLYANVLSAFCLVALCLSIRAVCRVDCQTVPLLVSHGPVLPCNNFSKETCGPVLHCLRATESKLNCLAGPCRAPALSPGQVLHQIRWQQPLSVPGTAHPTRQCHSAQLWLPADCSPGPGGWPHSRAARGAVRGRHGRTGTGHAVPSGSEAFPYVLASC